MNKSVSTEDALCLGDFSQPTNSAADGYKLRSARATKIMVTYLRTVAAAVVDTVHAPPAITFLHEPQFQMPTAVRFTES
jgi:hypothetical protein